MDITRIPGLLTSAQSPEGLATAQNTAAQALAARGLPAFPTNACALTLSALLRQAGIDVPLTFGAGSLAHKLGGPGSARRWRYVPVGSQSAGDVGVCFDNNPPAGADHIYLVLQTLGVDEMIVADNQATLPHRRLASGNGKTPTDYFLRATGDADDVVAAVAKSAAAKPSKPQIADKLNSVKTAASERYDVAQAAITSLAATSEVARYRWVDRDKAPAAYICGMAMAYAVLRAKLDGGDLASTEMARASTGDVATDALAWFGETFNALGMRNDVGGGSTLRHLFVLLLGLGMRESSGKYCEGRDKSAANTTADTAEAGLFQMSFNACSAHSMMRTVFERSQGRTDLLGIFSADVRCKAGHEENFGAGDGAVYQQLAKQNPLFAVEFAALGLRHVRRHWGPVNRREVEVLDISNRLFLEVDKQIETHNFSVLFFQK